MAGTLSIVATPIGNLQDITLRALEVLRTVELVACEDTRRTHHLLAHFGIDTRTVSFHEHNVRARLPAILGRLQEGARVALVSDAGTPVLSDPGLELVQACIEGHIPVESMPGASAPLALAVISGFPMLPWTIYGFPPNRSSDRKYWLAKLAEVPHSVTFFEAPHRVERTLADLAEICGERPIAVGRELTKLHETCYRGTVGSVAREVEARGELTIMLGPALQPTASNQILPSDAELALELGDMTDISGGRRAALKELATRHGLSTREVFAAVERAKKREDRERR